VPLDWATTMNNLGNALIALGEREDRTDKLDEAIKAFRLALLERTREREPLEWAMTHHNLGLVLHALGERENSTEKLEEAVKAYQRALLEYSPSANRSTGRRLDQRWRALLRFLN
jgi:tetratricopeptide (TPR) repeat protein